MGFYKMERWRGRGGAGRKVHQEVVSPPSAIVLFLVLVLVLSSREIP
jgi:hypothetical protein